MLEAAIFNEPYEEMVVVKVSRITSAAEIMLTTYSPRTSSSFQCANITWCLSSVKFTLGSLCVLAWCVYSWTDNELKVSAQQQDRWLE